MEEPLPESAAVEPAPRRAHPIRNFVVQLLTITAGVLIALFFEGLVGWNQNRALVREARAMIAREIASNKKEVDGELATLDDRAARLDTAVRMANELLATKTTTVTKLDLGVSFAELQNVSWRSAERTGAVGHMDFSEVQEYSRVYDFQELYTAHQRRAVERLAAVLSILASGDPHRAAPRDLEAFRQQILALRGDMVIEGQLLARLSEMYGRRLQQRPGEQRGSANPSSR